MMDMTRPNRFILITLFILSCSIAVVAGDVSLAWDAVTEPDIVGYKVYYGTASRTYGTPLLAGNQTIYTVSGSYLPPGHTYFFAVTAYDESGNESDYSNEVSLAIPAQTDTTPPAISNVGISNLNRTGATITWTTNEASDSRVEYGTTTDYVSSTTLDASMVTLHSQALTGLAADTFYHYRVISADAAGNLAISADYTFTTQAASDTTPPVISLVAVSNITSTSAVISWKTNKPTDTKVEYGKAIEYASSTSLGDLTTDHSIKLYRLNPGAQYHFRAVSIDENGVQAITGDLTFTTLPLPEIVKTLVIPRSSAGQTGTSSAGGTNNAQASASIHEYLGFALINMDNNLATVALTALDSMGNVIAASDITNPVFDELNAGEQIGVVDLEIFGDGLYSSASAGYVKVESTSTKITGIYATFDSDLDSNLMALDGADLADEPMTTIVFPEIGSGDNANLNIFNTNTDQVDLTFELVSAGGKVHASAQKMIAGNGALTADLFSDLFAAVTPNSNDYVRIRASKGVHAFVSLRKGTGDNAALIGQDADEGSVTLYSPQFAVGGIYRSSLSIVNLDSAAGIVTIRFIGENGAQIGETRVITLLPNCKAYIDNPEFFGNLDLDVLNEGYLEIKSTGIDLTGSILFGESSGGTFLTALPLISMLQRSVLFSHIASNDIYYTGYAIVNPNSADATAQFDVFAEDGSLMCSTILKIPAWQRRTKVLTEYCPELAGQDITSGYVRILVDEPVAAYSVYGTTNLSVVCAIPTQKIP